MFQFNLKWDQIPPSVKSFSLKMLLLFIVWELLYLWVLFPLRMPDEQLTNITAAGTAHLLSFVFPDNHFYCQSVIEGVPVSIKTIVLVNGIKLIGIADGCNAFELQVIYASILICLQKMHRKTIWYILIGVPLISICNIFRCSIIGWLNITQHLNLSVFAHHYLFKIVMYGLIFLGWVSYTNQTVQYEQH